jgi:hypothetical protein
MSRQALVASLALIPVSLSPAVVGETLNASDPSSPASAPEDITLTSILPACAWPSAPV